MYVLLTILCDSVPTGRKGVTASTIQTLEGHRLNYLINYRPTHVCHFTVKKTMINIKRVKKKRT